MRCEKTVATHLQDRLRERKSKEGTSWSVELKREEAVADKLTRVGVQHSLEDGQESLVRLGSLNGDHIGIARQVQHIVSLVY